jgi:hypothetical protein
MSGEVDPYVPPAVDPTRPSSESRDGGRLWRVIDDRLRVRNMASLPDVCVYGYAEEEPGTRVSMVLQTLPHWIGQILWWVAVVMMLWGDVRLEWSFALICLAILLPNFLGKRVQIMIFRSRRAARHLMLRGILFVSVMLGAIYFSSQYHIQWRWEFFGINGDMGVGIILVAGLLWNLIPTKGPSRVIPMGDGWFGVKGVHPEAVRRLAVIQQRAESVRRPA